MSRVVATRLPVSLRRAGLITLACSAALLSACGGGDRKNFFNPDRVVAFGDENSALEADTTSVLLDASGNPTTLPGLNYTVQTSTVVGPDVCTYVVSPSVCQADSGAAFASVEQAHYVLRASLPWVTLRELDAAVSTPPTNQRTTIVTHECEVPTTWVQIVARGYGKGFTSQCPTDSLGGAVSHAVLGAKSDDVIAQFSAHRGELGSGTVATVMAGQNDILEQYGLVRGNAKSEGAAIGELQARADRMANAIKDVLIGSGAKVIVALTPDVGQSPKALVEDSALMTRLVKAYNERLYVRGLGTVSGRSLAGVNPDSYTNPNTRSSSYVVATPLCDADAVRRPDGTTPVTVDDKLKYCTTRYIVAGGSVSTYLWADATRAAPLLHSLIGVQGVSRAREQF